MKDHTLNIMRSKAGHYWVTVRSTKYPGIKLREQFSSIHQAHDGVPNLVRELSTQIQARDDSAGHMRICAAVAALEVAA